MLISDERDNDVFFDSLDCLAPSQDSLLTSSQEFGYDIWLNEPLSVNERREKFLQNMGLVHVSVSNGCILPAEQVSENLVASEREAKDEKQDASIQGKVDEVSCSNQELIHREAGNLNESEFRAIDTGKKIMKNWWQQLVNSGKVVRGKVTSKLNNTSAKKSRRINVRHNKKNWMELSAMYIGQEIRAHKGIIWTMKFSPNGQYLATGGEDGVVRIWRVSSPNALSICFAAEDSVVNKLKDDISFSEKKQLRRPPVVLPNRILKIDESPTQELYGHSSDVMDLAWSDSNVLLSSSMDKTVRMWKIGCDRCLRVFHHKDYVTCIQFNPVNENYFISGSIDGKVRIWGIHERRVVDWADVHDVISAISYQPDGKGFVVGSLSGTCRFYVASGKHFQLEAHIRVNGKKKTSGNKITSIQFSQKNHQRVMITSRDSKVRILEGVELVQTYKGLPMSGSQMSGSFTSSGKHVISVGEDSRVYMWNSNDLGNTSSKQRKSESSCEYFRSKGVTVAVPWSGMRAERRCSCSNLADSSSLKPHQLAFAPGFRESERFSFGSWFSIDGSCRGSMTWPEENLPSWDLPIEGKPCLKDQWYHNCVPETWGLSVVAAGLDGTIKTFHNFGLPVRL